MRSARRGSPVESSSSGFIRARAVRTSRSIMTWQLRIDLEVLERPDAAASTKSFFEPRAVVRKFARDSQPGDESITAGERVNGRGTHYRICRSPRGKLHHAGTEPVAFRLRGNEGKRTNRIGTVHGQSPRLSRNDFAENRIR